MSPSFTEAAPLFAALGDETRLRIVARLCAAGPMSIARLTAGSHVSRQAITKHLHALTEAGLVESARSGRERVWRLEMRRLREVTAYLERISAQWDTALLRLRAYVEDE